MIVRSDIRLVQAEVTSVRKTALAMRVNYMGGELSHGRGLGRLQRKTTSLKGLRLRRMSNNGFRFRTC